VSDTCALAYDIDRPHSVIACASKCRGRRKSGVKLKGPCHLLGTYLYLGALSDARMALDLPISRAIRKEKFPGVLLGGCHDAPYRAS
jgi:hypothetical protein